MSIPTDKDSCSNLNGPDIWVKKWVDYSSKYGLGYLLSNGFSGVFFNDSSKIILDQNTKIFYYIERRPNENKEIISSYNIDLFPMPLQKKVKLLKKFKNFLEGETNANSSNEVHSNSKKENNEEKPAENQNIGPDKKDNSITYVKKWMQTKQAIMFSLSNKIVQVCLVDRTEIILSGESKIVIYWNKKGERMIYPLNTAFETTNYEMIKRLKLTKDLLSLIVKSAQIIQNINNYNNQDNYKSNNNGKENPE